MEAEGRNPWTWFREVEHGDPFPGSSGRSYDSDTRTGDSRSAVAVWTPR